MADSRYQRRTEGVFSIELRRPANFGARQAAVRATQVAGVVLDDAANTPTSRSSTSICPRPASQYRLRSSRPLHLALLKHSDAFSFQHDSIRDDRVRGRGEHVLGVQISRCPVRAHAHALAICVFARSSFWTSRSGSCTRQKSFPSRAGTANASAPNRASVVALRSALHRRRESGRFLRRRFDAARKVPRRRVFNDKIPRYRSPHVLQSYPFGPVATPRCFCIASVARVSPVVCFRRCHVVSLLVVQRDRYAS